MMDASKRNKNHAICFQQSNWLSTKTYDDSCLKVVQWSTWFPTFYSQFFIISTDQYP